VGTPNPHGAKALFKKSQAVNLGKKRLTTLKEPCMQGRARLIFADLPVLPPHAAVF